MSRKTITATGGKWIDDKSLTLAMVTLPPKSAVRYNICNDSNIYYIVAESDGKMASTCTLAIMKNLTRNLRPYGLIENVITHPDYRHKGLGTKVLNKAVEIANKNNCYKVMLLTSSKEEGTLKFYEKAGFEKGIKTGFVISL